jgi:flagellin-like protein
MTSIRTKIDDRAVSPVIGVILMVAITVILAAVIGTFVLGLGSGQSANPSVAVTYDGGSDTARITSIDKADKVTITWEGSSTSKTFGPSGTETLSVGNTVSEGSGGSYTGTVTVKATYEGKSTVITTYEDTTS